MDITPYKIRDLVFFPEHAKERVQGPLVSLVLDHNAQELDKDIVSGPRQRDY